jgi:4-hydroxy-tetrahydrodipicolinate reductase
MNTPMKIALIGYGKMGKMIEQVARQRGHQVGLIIDLDNASELTPENLKGHDVAIEFTIPETAAQNISACFNARIPVVSGTTGWQTKFEAIKQRCIDENQSFVHASNFSPGVNILFSLNRQLAAIMNNYPSFKISMKEIHHTQKLDAPSGTAITLANDIISNHKTYGQWHLTTRETAGKAPAGPGTSAKESIPINAIRENQVTGTHEVTYDSDFDSLTLRHEAKNREGFAFGALLAAEFIINRKGIYSMQDVLGF